MSLRKTIQNLIKEELTYIKGGKHPDYQEEDLLINSDSDLDDVPRPKKTRNYKSQTNVSMEDLEAFVKRAQKMIDKNHEDNEYHDFMKKTLVIEKGRKYARIVVADANGASRSAWAFIDLSNGNILKPASWAAPAKHARGNIYDEYGGMKYLGPYGPAYLR